MQSMGILRGFPVETPSLSTSLKVGQCPTTPIRPGSECKNPMLEGLRVEFCDFGGVDTAEWAAASMTCYDAQMGEEYGGK